MTQGLLIAVCGIDGSGKSTLVELLAQTLRADGTEVEIQRPLVGDTAFVKAVRGLRAEFGAANTDLMAATEQFFAAYYSFTLSHNIRTFVLPALRRGAVVICDRYLYSHYVNQRVLGNDLRPFEAFLQHLPHPDLTFYVDVSVETAVQRIAQRAKTGAFDQVWFLDGARRIFLELSLEHGFIVLRGEQSPDALVNEAVTHVRAAQAGRVRE